MVKVCLECGGEGFTVAFVHCRGCKLHVIHRYCLHPLPGLEECVLWFCEDCKPKFESLSQSKKHPILVKGSDYATLKKATKARGSSLTKVDVLRIEIYSSPQNAKAPSLKNSTEDVELLIQNEGDRSHVQDLQTVSVEVQHGCLKTFDSSDQHQRKKRLRNDDENEASLRKCNGLDKEATVEQAEPLSSKECVKINDNNEEREGPKRLKIVAETEAPLRDFQSPEIICHKVGEQDKELGKGDRPNEKAMVEQVQCLTTEDSMVELGKGDRPNEETMVEQAQCLTTEDSFTTRNTNNNHEKENRLKKDNEHGASPCEPERFKVSSSMAGEQGEELGRCNNMEEDTMVAHGEPLTGKDSQVGVCEMPLQTLVCEDMETEHDKADRNDSTTSQPSVPYAPVQPILNVCALPIKDPSWRGSLSIIDRVFGSSTQFVAHLSSIACARVTEATNLLPKLLSTDLLPRLDVWPKGFQKCSPGGNSIALYFFPESERDEKISSKLVQRMINQDLGIKSVLEDAELLIFTSTVLPEQYRKFQEKEYLWGVFRGKQPSKVARDVSNQKNHTEIQNTPSPTSMSESVANRLNRWRAILDKENLSNTNFLNWFRNLRIVLRTVKMLYVIEQPIPDEPALTSSQSEKDAFRKHRDDASHVGRLMLSTMEPELRSQHENLMAFDMIQRLKMMFRVQISQERCEISNALFRCKMAEGTLAGPHVLKMVEHVETLESLGFPLRKEIVVNLVLQSLPESFRIFVTNYVMQHLEKTLGELLNMLLIAERNISNAEPKVSTVGRAINPCTQVLKPVTNIADKKTKPVKDVRCFRCNNKGHLKNNCLKHLDDLAEAEQRPNHSTRVSKPKRKKLKVASDSQPKRKKLKKASDGKCFHCNEKGHWRRNCPKYLEAKRSKASASGTN